MNKFENMNKEVIPDPLTGGTQTIYTSQDGTFMMSIPDRCVPGATIHPRFKYKEPEPGTDNKIRIWTWETE